MLRTIGLILLLSMSMALAQERWKPAPRLENHLHPDFTRIVGKYEMRLPKLGVARGGRHGEFRFDLLIGLSFLSVKESPKSRKVKETTQRELKEIAQRYASGEVRTGKATQGRINGMPFLRTPYSYFCQNRHHPEHFGLLYVYNGSSHPVRVVINATLSKGDFDPELLHSSISTFRVIKVKKKK